MSPQAEIRPPVLGLFQKRIEGDDWLMELAKLRFQQAGLGAELYAATPEELDWLWQFHPAPQSPTVVHLSRSVDLFDETSRWMVCEFAHRFGQRLLGLVVHDQPELATYPDDYLHVVREMDARLQAIPGSPWLFIEYAVGVEPAAFAAFASQIAGLGRTSLCLDVGHVGVRQVRAAFVRQRPGEDVCALKSHVVEWPERVEEVQRAVASALPAVLGLIESVGRTAPQLHFHLHDGHPLSTFSPFGVSDHLSFLGSIPIAFEHAGCRSLPLMFGPAGLKAIVEKALAVLGPERLSFTLEIHPGENRLPLGDASGLFEHWRDKANAERMNAWLSVLAENHRLVTEVFEGKAKPEAPA